MTPSSLGAAYAGAVAELHAGIVAANAAAVAAAASAVAGRLAEDRLVFVAGPGAHSQLAVQDVFCRPGLPAGLVPVIDRATLLTEGAFRSTAHERRPGRAEEILAPYGIERHDVVLLVNASGVNATVIDLARALQRRGAVVIGYSSVRAEEAITEGHPARWEPGVSLSRVADMHVDTLVPPGDTAAVAGVGEVPLATTANAFALTWTLLEAGAILDAGAVHDAGGLDVGSTTAARWASSYRPGGDARNAELALRYRDRVEAL
ncbi:SIS domain-containing protein [Cnuibacter physcomitrellae]|uniref:SIS domain-containing protein n=1 Tax=Cnuibacter physcomitrellae TaxID=1619308 RepID=UPI002175CA3E|nr:SIS domain-containing protein [Cnuibacter physcomitrellae]MCS5497241.1 SIS domain-containing protein [Cnuibacter physcomitrellae]